MKTQVIELEPHDDVISVRDKMAWAKTERIILVIPRQTHLHSRRLDLLHLQRHASTLGAQLAIVTGVEDIQKIAGELDIPLFTKLSTAKKKTWQAAEDRPQEFKHTAPPDLLRLRRAAFPPELAWQTRDDIRFGFFSLAVLALLVVLVLFIPSASIRLAPATRLQSITFPVSASMEISAVQAEGSLPAYSTSIIIERSKTISATGSVAIPFARASGQVRFRNLTGLAVSIPVGTVVSTQSVPPISFLTTASADLPAGLDKTVNVPVMAVEPGSAGNLPPDSLVAMQVNLGAGLSVTNPKAVSGGTDRKTTMPISADRIKIRSALSAEILNECKTSLQDSLAAGDTWFPGSLVISQTLTETYFPAEGQPGDALSLTLRLQCQAQYASARDVKDLAEMLLTTGLPAGYFPVSGGPVLEADSTPATDEQGVTRWNIRAQSLLQAYIDPLAVVELSLGHRPATAEQQLSRVLPLASSPVVQVKPAWWPWLPLVPFNIKVGMGG